MKNWYWTRELTLYGTDYGEWATATSSMSLPQIWYWEQPLPIEHTAETIVRLLKFCDNCDSLQIKGKKKCPFCDAPYRRIL